jgi:hypothetical protein
MSAFQPNQTPIITQAAPVIAGTGPAAFSLEKAEFKVGG